MQQHTRMFGIGQGSAVQGGRARQLQLQLQHPAHTQHRVVAVVVSSRASRLIKLSEVAGAVGEGPWGGLSSPVYRWDGQARHVSPSPSLPAESARQESDNV